MSSDITDSHNQAVDAIASNIKIFYNRKEPIKLLIPDVIDPATRSRATSLFDYALF
jgi:hypothetical protein